MNHDEYHRKFADAIIEQIRQGTAPWQKPWAPGERVMPMNVDTDRSYRGGNSLHLASVQQEVGYGDEALLSPRFTNRTRRIGYVEVCYLRLVAGRALGDRVEISPGDPASQSVDAIHFPGHEDEHPSVRIDIRQRAKIAVMYRPGVPGQKRLKSGKFGIRERPTRIGQIVKPNAVIAHEPDHRPNLTGLLARAVAISIEGHRVAVRIVDGIGERVQGSSGPIGPSQASRQAAIALHDLVVPSPVARWIEDLLTEAGWLPSSVSVESRQVRSAQVCGRERPRGGEEVGHAAASLGGHGGIARNACHGDRGQRGRHLRGGNYADKVLGPGRGTRQVETAVASVCVTVPAHGKRKILLSRWGHAHRRVVAATERGDAQLGFPRRQAVRVGYLDDQTRCVGGSHRGGETAE